MVIQQLAMRKIPFTMSKLLMASVTVALMVTLTHATMLPHSVKPEHYRLEIVTHFEDMDFIFTGKVWILAFCAEPTMNITLHSLHLEIHQEGVEVVSLADGERIPVAFHSFDEENEFYTLHLGRKLVSGNQYMVHIPYQGKLSSNMRGYYKASYEVSSQGRKRWMSCTQFEPTYARRAFPCFDEPLLKAGFEVSLARRQNYVAISNMPLKSTEAAGEDMPGWIWDHFHESPAMSTYFVSFILSELVKGETRNIASSNATMSIWTRPGLLSQADYAIDIGPQIMRFYHHYLDSTYPLPKLDLVAVPEFENGAVGNLGIILFREPDVLFNPNVSSVMSQQKVASILAHELAHQWFGNLITPKWWTDLWLIEAFANYMSTLAIENVEPLWRVSEIKEVDYLLKVHSRDSMRTTHPITMELHDPGSNFQIFDKISYNKGAIILWMAHSFLSGQTLRTAVRKIVKDNLFQNTQTDEVWGTFTAQAHEDHRLPAGLTVKEILDTWTLQPGFPVLNVTRNYEEGTAYVTQRRFFLHPRRNNTEEPRWWVPITYATEEMPDFSSTLPSQWMNGEAPVVIGGLPARDQWVVLNIGGRGLYKVNYDLTNWNLLAGYLNSEEYQKIPPMNRAVIVDDAMKLARAGDLDYHLAMTILSYLSREKDYVPWKVALTNVERLFKLTKQYSGNLAFAKYLGNLLTPMYEELGFRSHDEDSLEETLQRQQILQWACRVEILDCITSSESLFRSWMKQENPGVQNPVSPNLKRVVYCTAVEHGSINEWDFAWKRYLESNVPIEREVLLSTLGCSRKLSLLKRYLAWTIDDTSGIRRQDRKAVFFAVCNNDIGYSVAKEFLFNNIVAIRKKYGQIDSLLRAVSSNMCSEKELIELHSFFKTKRRIIGASKLGMKQVLERVQANVDWVNDNYNYVIQWLENQ